MSRTIKEVRSPMNSPAPLRLSRLVGTGRGQGAGYQHSTLNAQHSTPPFKGGWEAHPFHPPTRYPHACPDPASLPPAFDCPRLHPRPARPRFASHRRLRHTPPLPPHQTHTHSSRRRNQPKDHLQRRLMIATK